MSDPGSDRFEPRMDVVVVGAGISGLTLAWRLQQQGWRVLLAEASQRAGGSLSTQTRNGFLWEEGPNSFLPTPPLLNLIAELGLADQLQLADGKLPRYVYWDGELLPIPLSPPALLTSPLLSIGGKLRALQGALGFVGPPPGREETVAQFFGRQLGSEVLQRLVVPFVSGVYAGDAQQLSASAAFGRIADLEANYGSLFAGFLQSPRRQPDPISPAIQPRPQRGQLGNFAAGLQQLPQALAQHLDSALCLGWRAESLQQEGSGWQLAFKTATGMRQVQARAVVLTVPAYAAAELLAPLASRAAELLRAIAYPAVAVVTLAYPESALPRPLLGFGHLIPRSQGLRTLGTIWASSLFPGRAPAGQHCLLSFIGGSTDPDLARQQGIRPIAELSPVERAEIVHRELGRILLRRSVEPTLLGDRLWEKAIPQYTLGHRGRVTQIQRVLAGMPGLSLCGNYLDGVSLGDCVRRAEAEALLAGSFLQAQTG